MVGGVGTASLPVGVTRVTASAPGYASATFPVAAEAGRPSRLNVTLKAAKVAVKQDRIEIYDKIYFDTNRATIKPASFPLLDEIAAVLTARPDILLVRVEGHTDSRGDNATNQTLSDLRAASVRDALVQRGISPDRLRSVGYGETQPLDDRPTAAAWDKNRRVAFAIERWAP